MPFLNDEGTVNPRKSPKNLKISRKNDFLLKRKITALQPTTGYTDALRSYFERALDHGANTQHRVSEIKKVLKEFWVVQAEKRRTFKIFEDFATFEELLFQRKDYRAHFAHQFNVFLLGYYILNKLRQNHRRTANVFTEGSGNPNFTWMLSATFHDMGYPIEQLDYWFQKFLKMFLKVDIQYQIKLEEVLTPLFFEYAKYLSEEHFNRRTGGGSHAVPLSLRIDWKFHNILLTRLRKKDHGVISALLLMHSLLTQEDIKRFSRDDWIWLQGTFPKEILPACHAIATHHLEEIKISQKQYPYAFLLILCDVLQDWGRSIGQSDYSELADINIDCSKRNPEIACVLRINNEKKLKELDGLKKRLHADTYKVVIEQEDTRRKWEIS